MKNFCIISEFNPFHNGHEYLIKKARELGADTVTCVMSGNATQRGELAIVDKYVRAEATIKSGADLVLELPFPWSSSSAEFFGAAGVSIAKCFGDVLLFGSESGDIDMLKKAAAYSESEEFRAGYTERTQRGEGSAAAYCDCLHSFGIAELSSNDLLGVAYIKAIEKQRAALEVMTVKRIGAAYNSERIEKEIFQSATALRRCIAEGNESAKEYMPSIMWELICREAEIGRVTDISRLDALILGYFRLKDKEEISGFAECDGGIGNRICDLAHKCTSAQELFSELRTKRYTDAKLRRAVLYALTGATEKDIRTFPEYTLLLGASTRGRELLANKKRESDVRVITKPADAPVGTRQYEIAFGLEGIFTLARENRGTTGEHLRKKAYIEIDEKT